MPVPEIPPTTINRRNKDENMDRDAGADERRREVAEQAGHDLLPATSRLVWPLTP